MKNTTVISNSNTGVLAFPSASAIVNMAIDHSHIDMNSVVGVKGNSRSGGLVNIAILKEIHQPQRRLRSCCDERVNGKCRDRLDSPYHCFERDDRGPVECNERRTLTLTVGSSMLSNNGTATTITAGGTLLSYGNNQITGPLGTGFSGGSVLQ